MITADKFPGLIAIALVLILIPGVLPALADDEVSTALRVPPNSSSNGKDLQFMGVVEPGKRLNIRMMPTENVKQLMVGINDSVKRDDIVVVLSSDQLVGSLADLQQKKNAIEQSGQQSEILKLEIEIRKQNLARIDKEMAKEKDLAKSISGYSSTVFNQLENQRQQLVDQVVILQARHDLSRKSDKLNNELLTLLDEQIFEIRSRLKALTIRVPFDGKVKYVAPDPDRIAPGGILCEIWDESYYRVKGTIIQHQFDLIKPGDRVRVSIDFVSDGEVTGIVQSIAQSRERRQMEGYASFEVMVEVKDTLGVFQPGMMVSILRNDLDNQEGQ